MPTPPISPLPQPPSAEQRHRFNRLRRCLLLRLYDLFQHYPYATMEVAELAQACEVEAGELNWNLVYLEKSGLVELGKSYPPPPFIAAAVAISARGVGLVEDGEQMQRRFPMPDDQGPNGSTTRETRGLGPKG